MAQFTMRGKQLLLAIGFAFSNDFSSGRLRYDRLGPFGNFTNVALRQRVGCVDPISGVPKSVQWDKVPYFYPIQILQFGLGQYNLIRKGKEVIVRRLERIRTTFANDANDTMALGEADTVPIKLFRRLPILLFSLKTHGMDSEFVVTLEKRLKGGGTMEMALFFKHSQERRCVWRDKSIKVPPISAVFNIGPKPTLHWVDFVIDTNIYMAKALKIICDGKNEHKINVRTKSEFCQGELNASPERFFPKSLFFRGPCLLRMHSLRQQSSAHPEMILKVTEWLLSRQDERGGWPVPVTRTISEGSHRLVLPIGWQSAMAQAGLALSFLTRVYALAKEDDKERYLQSAQKALDLFELPSKEGGVLSSICDLPWFEEYPTLPGTGVLNGFMYALFGLFDFALHSKKSRALFDRGLDSLHRLLHLFDNGRWSLYDLRHVHLNTTPKMARLDYHLLHVSQLRWMYSITEDSLFEETAKRWEEYARG